MLWKVPLLVVLVYLEILLDMYDVNLALKIHRAIVEKVDSEF